MALKLYNTLTRKIEEFKPIKAKEVRIYACGPTVYDFPHIGNFRTFIFTDILRRYLKYKKYKLIDVMNITDVDDKTIKGSKKEGISLKTYTKRYEDAFFEDLKTLNIEKAKYHPRATENIKEMVELIKKLLKKGVAYKEHDGSIYYDISKFKNYGMLSHMKIEELEAGKRVKSDEYEKEHVNDFALWKAWDEADGDVFWQTELGKGRPGWHIECSVMSSKYLGQPFDIHTGGVDLIFPHHENEIAQSEGANDKKFVNYWLHCEHLLVDGRKMSKSLGNFYTLRDLLKQGLKPKAIRYVLMTTHYKQQLNFTIESVRSAENAVQRLQDFMIKLDECNGKGADIKKWVSKVKKDFEIAMDNNLEISQALAAIFDFVKEINKIMEKLSKKNAKEIKDLMMDFDKILAVLETKKEKLSEDIDALVKKREEARKNKDFKTADKIRDQLKEKGIILEDTPQGIRWKKV